MKNKAIFFSLFASLISLGVAGQDDPWIKSTKDRFDIFNRKAVQEKMYVHIDRQFYLVGETVWFKAYDVEGSTNQYMNLSKVGYLEILDKENNSVAQTKFGMVSGKGNGSMIIPSTVPSGNYKIRAYTNWMKNFDAGYFFETNVSIVNPFVAFDPDPDKEKPVTYDVQFFPEGGNLVEGLTSKVGFRAIDSEGKGIDFSGEIVDQNNNSIVSFSPSVYGLGNFSLKPVADTEYKAIIKDKKGGSYTFKLPKVEKSGYVLTLNDSDGANLTLSLASHLPDGEQGNTYMAVHTKQQNLQVIPVEFKNNTANITIDKGKLGEGISHITLFDKRWRPLVERIFFKYPQTRLAIEGSVGKREFITREKVTVDLSASIGTEKIAKTDLSVAVFLEDSIRESSEQSIFSYLLLTSDLRGNVENPEYYFNSPDKRVLAEMDNIMLTHGWRRFNWKGALNSSDNFTYLPEYYGHFIQAKVLDISSGIPVSGKVAYLAAPDSPSRLYVADSDNDGVVRFEVMDFFGPKEITIQTHLASDSTYRFEMLSPFSKEFTTKPIPKFVFNKNVENELLKRTINMQAGNVFLPKSFAEGKSVMRDSLAFFGKPDETYFLDDFTRFPTMEEVLREYVRGVLVRRRNKSFHFRMIDAVLPNTIYTTDPLVLLDGIPMFNIDKIMEFDPLKIKKIELMNARYFMGVNTFTGIVSFSTYQSDLAGFELDPKVLVMPYEGIQSVREFYSPKYDTQVARASRIPDFRNLLHWEPNAVTDASGKTQLQFFTSDQTGRYRVVVHGMTQDGKAASQSFTFQVGKRGL